VSSRAAATLVAALAVLAAEGAACAVLAAPGGRLRLWVNLLSAQGIVVAIAGSFLLVDRPFAAARAVRRGGAGDGEDTPAARRLWGAALLLSGALLFGGAALIWFVARNG